MKKVVEHIIEDLPLATGIQRYCTLEPSNAFAFAKISVLNTLSAAKVKPLFTEVFSTAVRINSADHLKATLADEACMIKRHNFKIFSTEFNCNFRRTTEDLNYCGIESKTQNIFKHKNIPKTQSNNHLVLTYK